MKTTLKLCLISALAMTFAVACGPTEPADNTGNGDANNSMAAGMCGDGTKDADEECDDGNTDAGDGCDASCKTEAAAGMCGDGTVDDGEECDDGNTDAGDGCDADCKTEAASNNMMTGNNNTPAEATSCDSDPRPERCDADPGTFADWAPASIISTLKLVGEEGDDPCCFDYDGDDEVDNNLGETLAALGPAVGFSVADANTSIAEAIAGGSIALLLEHEGVKAEGGDFSVNFYLGEPDGEFTAPDPAGGNTYKIDPASFDEGVFPQARIDVATLSGTDVTSNSGTVAIAIELLGAVLNLRVTAARVAATVDLDRSGFDDGTGVALVDGSLGGVIRISDVIDALNNFLDTNCDCITGFEGSYISTDAEGAYVCAEGADTTTCDPDNETQDICVAIADNCGLAVGFLPALADIDADNIGGGDCADSETCNATSVGLTLEAHGAQITGVGVE